MTRALLCILFSACLVPVRAQPFVAADSARLYRAIAAARTDADQVASKLNLVQFYIRKPGRTKEDQRKAGELLDQALDIGRKPGNLRLLQHARIMQARRLNSMADTVASKRIFKEVISYWHTAGNKREEANAWYWSGLTHTLPNYFGWSMDRDVLVLEAYKAVFEHAMQQAVARSREAGDKVMQSKALKHLAYLHYNRREGQLAQKEAAGLVPLSKYPGTIPLYEIYDLLMLINHSEGNRARAIGFGLDALKNAADTGHENAMYYIYMHQGFAYTNDQRFADALTAFDKYRTLAARYQMPLSDDMITYYVRALTNSARIPDALHFLKTFDTGNPVYNGLTRTFIYLAQADLYRQLKQFDEAERLYLLCMKDKEKFPFAQQAPIRMKLAHMYVLDRKFEKARPLLTPILDSAAKSVHIGVVQDVHALMYSINLAAKNYPAAIDHMKQYIRLKDSLSGEASKKAISELMIKYQASEKERSIQQLTSQVRLKEVQSAESKNNIQLLNSKVRLQQVAADRNRKDLLLNNQQITLLKQENQLKEFSLARAENTRKGAIAGAVLLFIILGLIYYQYHVKKQANRLMLKQNLKLQQMVKEKELLVKEIHHRVKNNLHMVISLMESQAAYLEDDALLAMQNSQNRVQTMSLIHQKLYLTDNVTTVDMSVYIRELAVYLAGSFGAGRQVHFRLDLEPVSLDVSQAIPLGLILNELITNSFKYAFPGGRTGEIYIRLSVRPEDMVSISVGDNGIGLPGGFETGSKGSLGMQLVHGLSDDLGANLQITIQNGTQVSMLFKREQEIVMNA